MEFKSDIKTVKKALTAVLILSVILTAMTVILFVWDPDEPDLSFYGILIGVCAFGWLMALVLAFRAKNVKSLKFENDFIVINGLKIPVAEIQHVKIGASLGTMKPIKPQYANIDLMVTLPPEKGLSGSIKIIASRARFELFPLEDVMTAYTLFRKLGCDVEAVYTLGEKSRKYVWGDVA
ncbi:MAG: hypothetical protein IJ489_01545 [Clostridia bacterium]|nr:hypothetical protein [Clostridia bacterium]